MGFLKQILDKLNNYLQRIDQKVANSIFMMANNLSYRNKYVSMCHVREATIRKVGLREFFL